MATKGKGSDEGGSGAERKGRIPDRNDDPIEAEGPYGDTHIARDLEELEHESRRAAGQDDSVSPSRRGEEIAANPDNEEELAEEALAASSDEEDESQTHDRRRR
jgi:hypothetical protein